MKVGITFLALILSISASGLIAQSRRENPHESGKANKRTAESSPTPTPVNDLVKEAAGDNDDVIKVNTQLVSVPVRVMDKKGRFIGGLQKIGRAHV